MRSRRRVLGMAVSAGGCDFRAVCTGKEHGVPPFSASCCSRGDHRSGRRAPMVCAGAAAPPRRPPAPGDAAIPGDAGACQRTPLRGAGPACRRTTATAPRHACPVFSCPPAPCAGARHAAPCGYRPLAGGSSATAGPASIAAGLALLAAAYPLSSGNNLSTGTALVWLGGVWLLCRGLWEGTPPDLGLLSWLRALPERLAGLREQRVRIASELLVLLALTALAAFLRLYRLDAVPAEMTSDHAENILDIQDILAGHHMVFSPRNTGREVLLFWTTALALKWLPFTFLTLKLVVAAGSILAVPVAYLLARECYGREVAFFAAFFLTISKWAITIGRWGLRAGWTPLFVGLTLLYLVRALKYGRRNDFILCGLVLGTSLYVYTSLRVLPVVVVVLVLLATLRESWLRRRTLAPAPLAGLMMTAAVALAVFVPLGRYMVEHPESFWYRALTRMTGLERPVQASLPKLFVGNLRNSLLMTHWRGDIAWVTNVPGDPFLDPVSAGLATLGTFYLLWRVRHGVNAAALIAYLLLMMPSTLNFAFPQENPSAVRASTVMPVLFLFPAIPAALAWRAFAQEPAVLWRRLTTGGLVLLLLIALITNIRWYFEAYGPQYRRASQKTSDVARAAGGFVAAF
ncbi:MAG: hypothetical protein C4289_01210, partial [Chloroflexota bacterium]